MAQTAKLRLKSKEQLALFTDLATMLGAGIPLLEALELLEPDAKGTLKKILQELKRALENGDTMASAMARFPEAFEPVTINLMRAAEAGGTLEETLGDIVRTIQKQVSFSSDLRTAMIYPAFVMTIFTGILIMLLTFVIPRINTVFTTLHVKKPLATQILTRASTDFLHHWPIIVLTIVAAVALLVFMIRTYKRAIGRFILSLPGLKRLGITIDLARLTRSLTLLLKAGVPIEETLTLARRTVQKKEIAAVVSEMQHSIAAGKPLATGLRKYKGVIPPLMARSLETAEASGTLEQTLQRLAEHFDEQASTTLKSLSSLVEPLLIVGVGVIVGGLMITVIAPVYTMMSKIQTSGH
ncbi:MAG TPA: type II secretion system F family protein [Candidatus Saccharimonadales bacterium]|nr:type II secretion system F family protein [Candidatus Saccharimonadales bacterium]